MTRNPQQLLRGVRVHDVQPHGALLLASGSNSFAHVREHGSARGVQQCRGEHMRQPHDGEAPRQPMERDDIPDSLGGGGQEHKEARRQLPDSEYRRGAWGYRQDQTRLQKLRGQAEQRCPLLCSSC